MAVTNKVGETVQSENPLWSFGKFLGSYQTAISVAHMPERGFAIPFTKKAITKPVGAVATQWGKGKSLSTLAKTATAKNPVVSLGLGASGKGGIVTAKSRAIRRTLKGGTIIAKSSRSAAAKMALGRAASIGLRALYTYWNIAIPLELGALFYGSIVKAGKAEKGLEFGDYFPETKGSYTSRQRAVRAISSSRLQARSAIGNEAFLMHR